MRNLLGRLHARNADAIYRIARRWYIPLHGRDTSRHVGSLYRVMTDIRAIRTTWAQLSDAEQAVIRVLVAPDARPMTISELVVVLNETEDVVRPACVSLFHWGILAREGDTQELPVGQSPKVFVPRELATDFRRVQDEIEAGDQSSDRLRTLLELRDDPDLEETARKWGSSVIPGLRRRDELIAEILRAVSNPRRIDDAVKGLSAPARTLWEAVREQADHGPLLLAEAIEGSDLVVPDGPDHIATAHGAEQRSVLAELETSLLVQHTYGSDGSRLLFVPQEIVRPGAVATALPLRPLQGVPAEQVTDCRELPVYAVPWDVLTIVREINSRGAPAWVVGEPISRTWQRQLNSRLWLAGDEVPPEGYITTLMYLGLAVGVLEPGPRSTDKAEKDAIRPVVTPYSREWRGKSFEAQIYALRDAWFAANAWIEGRELDLIRVWTDDWDGFRRRLLGALRQIDTGQWYTVTALARFLAEQDNGMLGPGMTVSRARSQPNASDDARASAVAEVIEIEVSTALAWFGFVETGRAGARGMAVRVTEAAHLAAGDTRAVPELPAASGGTVMTVSESGLITLDPPSPIHIWSLSAFADAETLEPEATWQLRPGSVNRALTAGFDRDQIATYLRRHSGVDLPEQVTTDLAEWTAGFKRVRLHRLVQVVPDVDGELDRLRHALAKRKIETVDGPDGTLYVVVPRDPARGRSGEETVLAALRAGGYVPQWDEEKG